MADETMQDVLNQDPEDLEIQVEQSSQPVEAQPAYYQKRQDSYDGAQQQHFQAANNRPITMAAPHPSNAGFMGSPSIFPR